MSFEERNEEDQFAPEEADVVENICEEAAAEEEKAVVAKSADTNDVEKAIRTSVYAAMGMGVVPVPWFNFATVTGIQLNMVRQLSNLYGVPFKEGVAKKIIASVVGAGAGVLSTPFVESVLIGLPLVGLPLAIGTKPIMNGLSTYAVGRMFVTYFERGGNFLSANIDAMGEDFKAAYKTSREWLGNVIGGKKNQDAETVTTA